VGKKRLRVVVVDDSTLSRVLIRDALREIDTVSIVGSAENGILALKIIGELDPDVVTLDVEMPGMDGIQVLREMKIRGDRARTIMVSRHTAAGAQVTTDALMEGAFDFILKPSGGNVQANKRELTDALDGILEAVYESYYGSINVASVEDPAQQDEFVGETSRCELVLIGTSTGGPDALRRLLPSLPAGFRAPILVVQHMPPNYTASLAKRLDELCPLNVAEAQDDTPILPGSILIAPGGRHMGIAGSKGGLVTRLSNDPPEHSCRPAVDYLFRSAFQTVPQKKMLGVILTGMGNDGTEGCALLKDCGGRILAQDARECVVYGMPKSVIKNGLADRVIPLDQMADAICCEAK